MVTHCLLRENAVWLLGPRCDSAHSDPPICLALQAPLLSVYSCVWTHKAYMSIKSRCHFFSITHLASLRRGLSPKSVIRCRMVIKDSQVKPRFWGRMSFPGQKSPPPASRNTGCLSLVPIFQGPLALSTLAPCPHQQNILGVALP